MIINNYLKNRYDFNNFSFEKKKQLSMLVNLDKYKFLSIS